MLRVIHSSALTAVLALTPLSALAADAAGDIEVIAPYARAVPPVVPNSAAFMTLKNAGTGDRQLVAVSSPAAQTVELHTHINDEGVMRMRRVEAIAVPANGMTELKPGGLHIMLLGLHQPLKPGDQIGLTLQFADGSSESLSIPVRDIRSGGKMPAQDHHHH